MKKHILDIGRPLKAHDIRRLCACAICGGIGYKPQMLTLPNGACHGICIIETMTHDEILALPKEETNKLILKDTGVDLMRKLVQAL